MNENRYSSIIEEIIVKPVKNRFGKIENEFQTLSSVQESLKDKIIFLYTWVKVLSGICVMSLFLNILLIFNIL